MTRLQYFTALSMLLLSVTFAQANTNRFHLIGLSEDGKFVAYETYGIEDISGNPYAFIGLINTEKNSYAAPFISVHGAQDAPGKNLVAEVRRRAFKQVAPLLQSLNIKPGYTGIAVDPSSQSHTSRELMTYGLAKGLPERHIALTLRPIAVKAELKTCENNVQGFELSMSTSIDKGVTTTSTVLQKDAKIPESRGCPISYRLEDVTFSEHGHILVVLSYMNAVPDGPNLEYMMVTGRVK